VADETAPVRVMEWLLGPIAGIASGFFAAGRKTQAVDENRRRLDTLEATARAEAMAAQAKLDAATARTDSVRAEVRAEMKEMRGELLEELRSMRQDIRDDMRRLEMTRPKGPTP
jgi:seryl-tRNA synthetase